MSLRRVAGLAAMVLATLLWMSCGQVYRPVVLPISTVPPSPANFHEVFTLNGNIPYNQGTAMQIDVSGDSDIGVGNMGVNPTHAAILPNNSRVFVTSAGSLNLGDADLITAFAPTFQSSLGTGFSSITTFTLPNYGAGQSASITSISQVPNSNLVTVNLSSSLLNAQAGGVIVISGVVVTLSNPIRYDSRYDGSFTISSVSGTTLQYADPALDPGTPLPSASSGTATEPLPLFCSYLPDFVATAQNSAVFVSNFGTQNGPNCTRSSTDSVAQINPTQNVIIHLMYLPAGSQPVAMAATVDGQNLYVLTQANNLVTDLSPVDLSTLATIPVGNTPAWATLRVDGRRLYVVTQGDGQLYNISTATNTVLSATSVGGPGANFVLYDKSRNRLYVTNPAAGVVYVFDATTDPPTLLQTLTIAAPPVSSVASNCATYACSYSSVSPVSVAALPDGSRFYVASYVTGTAAASPATCPDPALTTPGCIIPQVTVYDSATFTVKTTIFPLLTSTSATVSPGFALTPASFCVPVFPYTPAAARFRMFAAAAVDGSKVYASLCDGGSVAIVNTTTSTVAAGQDNSVDSLVLDLPTPFNASPVSTGNPPTQNPFFMLTGQ